MAKRWLQQKRLKMKVYRAKARGILKMYSSEKVNVGRSINKEGMAALYSGKGLGVTMKDLQTFNFRYKPTPTSEPRQAARELREKVRNGTEPLRYFRLLDDAFARARLYYSSNPEYCYIIELDRRKKLHRRSIRYNDRDIAYARYCDDTIDWSEEFYHPLIPETHDPGGCANSPSG
jgi:hypothetical protein